MCRNTLIFFETWKIHNFLEFYIAHFEEAQKQKIYENKTDTTIIIPKIDFRGADHVPDGDTAVLGAGHHHPRVLFHLEAEG